MSTEQLAKWLRIAIKQNEHDMILTDEEIREARAALTAHEAEKYRRVGEAFTSADRTTRDSGSSHACLRDLYNAMAKHAAEKAKAAHAVPVAAPTPESTPGWSEEERRIGGVLSTAWAKAEPAHGVTLNPVSYQATFRDMARAVLRSLADHAAPIGWMIEGSDLVWRGDFARADAEQSARFVGGTCRAFPIYRGAADHIEMDMLEISHCKDAHAIRAALAAHEAEKAQAAAPLAYLYHDARAPQDAHPWLQSTMVVLAADRRPGLRGETPLYAAPAAPVAAPLTDDEAQRMQRIERAVGDWLRGGCDANDIPRAGIAALVSFAGYCARAKLEGGQG